ncbi:MAG: hypothetical protein B0A82_21455 [Alkalinema sp. CACIAM 70d]|uniref:alr0857 family protein n=1 Tax=Alkalinema sp. FACHB-956 TaxID=2692768 RepID=UPI000B639D5F|nr:alr0857 family protein [Alkalinema sp. FACHB-956]MBD2328215.1 hypothetical protein [Alkalinema sp. FACHB-956]OUC12644.1 MAG: hypothetical protein B0A82_21455 [Alkalinema sp. CACIAM 70d]
MLKITYTETGVYLERLYYTLEELVSLRVSLAMRLGQRLCVEPGTATILLPLRYKNALSALDRETEIAYCVCDSEFLEVELHGTWIAQDVQIQDGVFITEVSDRAEYILMKLWRDSRDFLALPR